MSESGVERYGGEWIMDRYGKEEDMMVMEKVGHTL